MQLQVLNWLNIAQINLFSWRKITVAVGLLYSADWTHGLDSRTGFTLMCGQEDDCKILVIMMIVISYQVRHD